MTVRFEVPGLAVTQGNLRAIRRKNGQVVAFHKNDTELRDFRARVAVAAQQAGVRPVEGPVALEVTWLLLRPKGHLRKDGTVRPGAPAFPTTRPDLDKLARALLDALAGIAYENDAQVVDMHPRKRYAAPGEGARVVVALGAPDGAAT